MIPAAVSIGDPIAAAIAVLTMIGLNLYEISMEMLSTRLLIHIMDMPILSKYPYLTNLKETTSVLLIVR